MMEGKLTIGDKDSNYAKHLLKDYCENRDQNIYYSSTRFPFYALYHENNADEFNFDSNSGDVWSLVCEAEDMQHGALQESDEEFENI